MSKKAKRALAVYLILFVLAATFAVGSLHFNGYISLPFMSEIEGGLKELGLPGKNKEKVSLSGEGELVFIGDSLTVGATQEILKLFPNASIYAQVGRFMDQGVELATQATYGKKLPNAIVIGLATNINDNTVRAIDDLLFLLQDIPVVVFVTGYGTDKTPELAELIRTLPVRGSNIRVADWEAVAIAHPEYLAGDGIHLNNAGHEAFALCIAEALE